MGRHARRVPPDSPPIVPCQDGKVPPSICPSCQAGNYAGWARHRKRRLIQIAGRS